MVTRKSLVSLAGVTLALFAVAGIIGNHQHGVLKVIADVSWNAFLVCVLFLIVACAATIVRHRTRLSRS